MAYGKYRRYRKNRRGFRNLSTRRIFNNKSAKAQAKQIYQLRKSINSVRRQCQPEIKTYDSPVLINNFTATRDDITDLPETLLMIAAPTISTGTDNWQRVGDKIRLLPLTWFINGLYRKITNTTNGTPLYNMLSSNGCAMRIVAIQSKTPHDTLPDYEDIFSGAFTDSTDPTESMTNINCPFRTGITTSYEILYNKVFYFNEDNPIKNLKIKLIPKLKYQRWEVGHTYPAGNIILFAMFGGLQTTGTPLQQNDYSQVELTHWLKLPFTDA